MHATRRTHLATGLAAGLAGVLGAAAPARTAASSDATDPAALEATTGGRIGVAARTRDGRRRLEHRAAERFPLCSTFKVLAAGAILAQVDAGRTALDRTMAYGPDDLDSYAPVARKRLAEAGGEAARLTLAEACAAAVIWSDNTAANLMLRALGGPGALTAWLGDLGDRTTRLDRWEPDLNSALPGDPRDTTTPAAMLDTLARLLDGPALSEAGRVRLEAWMGAAQTGMRRLRAGLPADWRVGDKTGTGANGTANVVAILRPPGGAPILAAVYMTGASATPETRDAAHAAIGRRIAAVLG